MNENSSIILISGSTRSGKSKFAEDILHKDTNVIYIATFNYDPKDLEWNKRILKHKTRRSRDWLLIEDFDDINSEIKNIKGEYTLLIDSLGGVIYRNLDKNANQWNLFSLNFIETVKRYPQKIVIVIEEVGWGISPITKTSNMFRDRIGELAQMLEQIANESYLIVRGKAINLNRDN